MKVTQVTTSSHVPTCSRTNNDQYLHLYTEYAEWCNNHFGMCLLLLSSMFLLMCLTMFVFMAVVSYSCHRSYCTLNLLLLFMKISNCDIISSKAESSFYFLFHPFSISISPSLNQTTITMPPRGI